MQYATVVPFDPWNQESTHLLGALTIPAGNQTAGLTLRLQTPTSLLIPRAHLVDYDVWGGEEGAADPQTLQC